MKNSTKRILRALAAITMSATMGVAMAFTTACNPGDGGDGDDTNTTQPGGDDTTDDGTGGGGGETVAVESVSLSQTSLSLKKGATATLTATITPSNATNKNVTWESSDTSVATVSNGTVTAVAKGTANITVKTNNNKTAVCEVTVTEDGATGTPETSTAYKTFVEEAGENLVYSNSFDTDADVPFGKDAAISEKGAKVYGTVNNSATAYSDDNKVSIKGGELVIYDNESTNTTTGAILLDSELSGVVTIYVEYKVDTAAGSWNHMALYNDSDEIFSIRTDSNKKLTYRTEGTGNVNHGTALDVTVNSTIAVELSLNFATKELQVKASTNGGALQDITANDWKELTVDAATGLTEIKFPTAGGARSTYVSNIAIKAEAASVNDVVAANDAKIAPINAKYTAESVLTAMKEAASTAKSNYDSADKSTVEKANEAYETYVAAILTALKANGVAMAKADYNENNYQHDAEQYQAVVTTLTGALTEADTIDAAQAAIDAAIASFGALHDDSYYQQEDVTVTVKINGNGSYAVTGKKVGDKLTKADIDAVIATALPAGHVVEGYYSNSAMDQAIEFGADGYVLSDTTFEVYVKTTEYTGFSVNFNDGSFTSGTTIVSGNDDTTEIKDKDGKGTGLIAMGESGGKEIKLDKQNSKTVLNFAGAGDTQKSSVRFVVPVSGQITITVSYFHGSSSNDRYMKLFDASKTLATTDANSDANGVKVETDGKTSSDKTEKTATITLTVEAGTVLYLGSASSGIYVTAISLAVVK